MKGTCARPVALVLVVVAIGIATGGVVAAGEPPLADAGLDQQVEQNATVLLDAAGSRDPDGEIGSYRWSIETPDGRTIRPADPDAPRTSFVARQPGRYEVTVTVTGEDGQTASDTLYVDVAPRTDGTPPTAPPPVDTTPGLPDSAAPDSDREFDAATPDAPLSTSTDGDSPATSTTTAACSSGTTRVESVGCLRGEDPPATVDVQGEVYVRQGSVHTYTAVVEDRPSGNERISWSGGVGTGNTLTRLFTQPVGSTVTITATVDDGEGHTTSDSLVVHIVGEDSPPEVRIEGPTTACVGDPVELEGFAVASEQNDEVVDSTWHGDPTFVPQGPGRYEVGFSATDNHGQTGETTHTVTVREDGECEDVDVETVVPRRQDKLLIRATDDNWVEGSGVSPLMRARGKVPDSGAVEKFADIGAASGKFGEATAEFVTGNRETVVVTMSAENASELERKIRTTPNDDTLAGASGPRINEHERLKNARVKDPVETSDGQVKVVIRIGKNNEGTPDQYTESDSTSEQEALTGRREPESTVDSEPTESTDQSLPSSSEQTHVLERSGPVEAATETVDTVTGAVDSAVGNLVGGGTESKKRDGDGSEPSTEADDSPDTDTSEWTPSSPSTAPQGSNTGDSAEAQSDSVTEAFSELDVGGSSDSNGSGDTGGGSSSSESSSSDESEIDGDGAWSGLT